MGRMEGISEDSAMVYTRRAGEVQGSHEDRRVDIINSLNVRVSILEAAHKDSVDARHEHSRAIEELNKSLHETASALREGLTAFSMKFDALLSQIKIGFFIISTGCAIVIFIAGLFFQYNKELDEKYIHTQKALAQQIESTDTDVQDLKNKKVIKASK